MNEKNGERSCPFILKVVRFRHRDGLTLWEEKDRRVFGSPGLVRVTVASKDDPGEVLGGMDFPFEGWAEAFVCGMKQHGLGVPDAIESFGRSR